MRKGVLIACLAVVVAFGGGWAAGARSSAVGKKVAAPPVATATLPDSFWVEMETQRTMMRQLQETCATRREVIVSAPPQETKPAQPADPSAIAAPEDPAPMASAQALVDHAVAGGRWTDDDAASMRASMNDMTPAQRDRAMHLLLHALNEQGVRRLTHGPGF